MFVDVSSSLTWHRFLFNFGLSGSIGFFSILDRDEIETTSQCFFYDFVVITQYINHITASGVFAYQNAGVVASPKSNDECKNDETRERKDY